MSEITLNLAYETFLDKYIVHTKILNSKFIANNFMKNVLYIPSKDLMKIRISIELRQKRKNLTKEFLKIIKKRNYRKEGNLYFA